MQLSRRNFLCGLFALPGASSLLLSAGCAPDNDSAASSGKLPVLVAVDPIAYLVERVGGNRVVVSALTPQGKDPETFAPTPGSLKAVAETKIFFRVGLPIEERFARNISSIAPNAETVDLCEKLDMLASAHHHDHGDNEREDDCDDHDEHEHEHEHEHDRGGDHDDDGGVEEGALDAHVWTSPANVREMVETIAETLAEEDPEGAETYRANAAAFDSELAALQTETAERLAPYRDRGFFVFHPAYGYYAREFELKQYAIEFEGKAPRPRDLNALIERVKQEKVTKLIVQPEFNRSSAQAIANAIDGELIDHSPLVKDYFANIRSLTDAVVASLEPAAQ